MKRTPKPEMPLSPDPSSNRFASLMSRTGRNLLGGAAVAATALVCSGPVMSAQASEDITANDPAEARFALPLFVEVAEFDEIDKLRVQSDRVRVQPSGETTPVYNFLIPEPGMMFVNLSMEVASENPKTFGYDEIALFDEHDSYKPTAVFRDESWVLVNAGDLVSIESKGMIEVAIAVPKASVDSMGLEVAGYVVPWVSSLDRLEDPDVHDVSDASPAKHDQDVALEQAGR